ncbi:MAG TPA: response regulator [Prolixibacteraceae bacterium]|jgi:CheY-like chemotaxis protein|nr:response regulator [Prolixibacteraceae bacterium]
MEYNFISKTILIVEDEEVSRFFFEKALKKTQANLFFVNDGIEAVNMINENTEIDVVLMDIRLPRMNGFEATSKIKEINPEMPIIIQTAYEMSSAKEEAIQCGCNEFITKPIKLQTLLALLQKHLKY